MAKKHLIHDMHGNFNLIDPQSDYKVKPKVWVENPVITEYKLKRDRVIYATADEETRKELMEKYGK